MPTVGAARPRFGVPPDLHHPGKVIAWVSRGGYGGEPTQWDLVARPCPDCKSGRPLSGNPLR